jgi:hypothetical protein
MFGSLGSRVVWIPRGGCVLRVCGREFYVLINGRNNEYTQYRHRSCLKTWEKTTYHLMIK